MDLSPGPDVSICIAQEFTTAERKEFEDQAPPGVMTLYIQQNIGFARSINLAMERAIGLGAEWVLVLNNDATVDHGCLEVCVNAGLDPCVGAISPAIRFMDSPDQLWYGGGRLNPRLGYPRHNGLHTKVGNVPPTSDTQYIPACCALYSTAAWRDVGPFKSEYFMYFEDVDWSVRARSRGWKLRYVGQVLASHAVGVSSGQRGSTGLTANPAYYLARNPLRFALEAEHLRLRASRVFGYAMVWSPYNALRLARARDLNVGRAYLEGLRDGLLGRMGPRGRPVPTDSPET
jgi:hypothetical protein